MIDDIDRMLVNSKDCINYFDIGKLLHSMYKTSYVVTNIKNKVWFCFKDHIWRRTEVGPYNELSTHVLNEFKVRLASISKRKKYEVATCEEIIKILCNPAEKEKILRECLYIFYDDKFLIKLDKSTTLIPFRDCIYDWKTKTTRPGKYDDYLSIHINEDLDVNNQKKNDKIIKDFVIFRNKVINKRVQLQDNFLYYLND